MYICDFSRSVGAGKGDDAEHARADALGDRLDRAAFAGAVASLEHDADLQALVHDPFLQLDQLDMQPGQFALVVLRLQFVAVPSAVSSLPTAWPYSSHSL